MLKILLLMCGAGLHCHASLSSRWWQDKRDPAAVPSSDSELLELLAARAGYNPELLGELESMLVNLSTSFCQQRFLQNFEHDRYKVVDIIYYR